MKLCESVVENEQKAMDKLSPIQLFDRKLGFDKSFIPVLFHPVKMLEAFRSFIFVNYEECLSL